MGRKKTVVTNTKKTTQKKAIKETVETPMSIKEVTQPVEVNFEDEIKIAEEVLTPTSEEKEELVEEIKTEAPKDAVEEINKQALQETFKENKTRIIDRVFGYYWNGQEMDY